MEGETEAKDIANKLLTLDNVQVSNCHMEWLEREIMKILEEKCKMEQKRQRYVKKSASTN